MEDAISVEDPSPPAPVSAGEALGFLLEGIVSDQYDVNRRMAARARHILEAIEMAKRHPYVYTVSEGPTAIRVAEQAVVFDLSLRLQLSEPAVRDLARVAQNAQTLLPALWARAEEGFAALTLVCAALTGAYRLTPAPGASPEEKAAAADARRQLDAKTADWALTLTPGGFRSRLTRLVDRLDARTAEVRHANAMRGRRVIVEHVDDGMAWISALIPAADAVAIKRRLTSTAKHIAKDRSHTRTRDQIRADLFSAWLRGDKTPTAVKTKIFVTVPAAILTGRAADAHGRCALCGGTGRPEAAKIVGHGEIDSLTAKQLFLDAAAFHRILTDPVRGVVVDMDRRTYRPTTAQRDWLTLQHGLCARDGCTRLALDADIDHDIPWATGGTTDLSNERPLCPRDHRHRHRTRFRFTTRPHGTVEVHTPTGFTTAESPPF